jgi:hypothetical protein
MLLLHNCVHLPVKAGSGHIPIKPIKADIPQFYLSVKGVSGQLYLTVKVVVLLYLPAKDVAPKLCQCVKVVVGAVPTCESCCFTAMSNFKSPLLYCICL